MGILCSELRIGNWVCYDGRFFQIDTIANEFPTLNTAEFGIGVVGWSQLKPIELTEEILLRCGAVEVIPRSGVLKAFKIKRIRIELSNSGNFYYKNSNINLHRLQNLYFAKYNT